MLAILRIQEREEVVTFINDGVQTFRLVKSIKQN
jgi:hypothetical protein